MCMSICVYLCTVEGFLLKGYKAMTRKGRIVRRVASNKMCMDIEVGEVKVDTLNEAVSKGSGGELTWCMI